MGHHKTNDGSAPAGSASSHLEDALEAALENRRRQGTLRKLTTHAVGAIDFSSNDFLSLASSAPLRKLFQAELLQDPAVASTLGSGGSRLLDGNSKYAEQLERDIAAFHGAPAGLLCTSGFDANAGIFASLPQPNDYILYDEYIHASVHDGMRLSRVHHRRQPFAHNSVSALRTALRSLYASHPLVRSGRHSVFVAVEGVYSMDGDIAPLVEIVAALRDLLPMGNGHLIVDEAHSTGLFGDDGRGLVSALGLEDQVSVRLHTFGKAMACNGAVILCRPIWREYLLNYARPLIYTTFMSYPGLAAIRASYSYLQGGHSRALVQNLQRLIHRLFTGLRQVQAAAAWSQQLAPLLQCPTECPRTPIVAVLSSEPKSLAAHCQRTGFVVRAIVPPTVPLGGERIRICVHAGNTSSQVDGLVETIRSWLEQFGEQSSGYDNVVGLGTSPQSRISRARL